MTNDTRTERKISRKRSYGEINHPQISTLLKQCGIILTKNGGKGSQHLKKSFGVDYKKPGELFLKSSIQELKTFQLCCNLQRADSWIVGCIDL